MKWNRNWTLVTVSLALGLLSGAIRPLLLDEAAHTELMVSLHRFAATLDTGNMGFAEILMNLLRYGRMLILIWACAITPKVRFVALLVLYMRAMALSFSAAMMIVAFGGIGLGYAFMLYGLQNMITMPIYVYATYVILQKRPITAKLVVISLAGIVVASIIATYIAPILFVMIRR